jgi:hypothetical protein
MIQIRRTKVFKPRFAVTDSRGFVSDWSGRFGREGATGVVDGETYTFRKDGRKRFALSAGEREVASAERIGRSERKWAIASEGRSYELVKPSAFRSKFELHADGATVGTITRRRRNTNCDLPDDVPLTVQSFVGFVAMALWSREAAAASGGSTGAVAASV